MSNKLKIRPYARLLTMLGEQLIKNEKVALTELIKNAYDADASWVQVRLTGFKVDHDDNDTLTPTTNAMIEIEDDGEGMTLDILKSAWMNPATPIKYKKKDSDKTRRTAVHKRIIQGEKGIGRFAIYKLASCANIITRSKQKPSDEIQVISDFSIYDHDFLSEGSKEKELFLDELEVEYDVKNEPMEIVPKEIKLLGGTIQRAAHGTIIRLTHIKGEWSRKKLEQIVEDVEKIESPFGTTNAQGSFTIDLKLNGESITSSDELKAQLGDYFGKAPIRVTDGHFDDQDMKFSFNLNDRRIVIGLDQLKGIREFRKRFVEKRGDQSLIKKPTCGPFQFRFYVFDLTSKAHPKYHLTGRDKDFVKGHRIYLYRDDIRVFPYGDPDDDWLGVDVLRGTSRASHYLSMDQTIGYVSISQEANTNLKDKTNREGLIEIGGTFSDFKALIQTVLGYLKFEYDKYKDSLKPKDVLNVFAEKRISSDIDRLEDAIKSKSLDRAAKILVEVKKNYDNEREYLTQRSEQTEDLAAVGLAVETTSHDIMMMIRRAKETMNLVLAGINSESPDVRELKEMLNKLSGQISFVEDQLEGIQPMFRSVKSKNQELNLEDVVRKVQTYFNTLLEYSNIDFQVNVLGDPLVVNCNEGILLQAFINLFDNSVYWLGTVDTERKILVSIDAKNRKVVVSDNGPGVDKTNLEYIFKPFFSTKGIQGRGLGLYIVNQILSRFDFGIEYVVEQKSMVLPGANFELHFPESK